MRGEIDHFFPLCAGGSNDITNLWFQPENNVWNGKNYGFREKDDLEAWICQQNQNWHARREKRI
ncbi:MAG TPA: hypothetical protein VH640_17370 [Bryobacteraceae bacterium]|jgi:hypothetical protein